jgi:methylthioribulose-1-phosphate dehydratase
VAAVYDQYPPRRALAMIARDFHARGWMTGTAGNLSARADDTDTFWITASGQPKGQLDEDDMLRVAVRSDAVLEPASGPYRPSAETAIHRALYQLFSDARAVFHTHSVEACLAAEHAQAGALTLALPPLEMVKGFGVWEQEPRLELPLFANLADLEQLALQIRRRFADHPPRVPALLIRAHGITVWGNSLQQAYHHVELTEFILRYMIMRGRIAS